MLKRAYVIGVEGVRLRWNSFEQADYLLPCSDSQATEYQEICSPRGIYSIVGLGVVAAQDASARAFSGKA